MPLTRKTPQRRHAANHRSRTTSPRVRLVKTEAKRLWHKADVERRHEARRATTWLGLHYGLGIAATLCAAVAGASGLLRHAPDVAGAFAIAATVLAGVQTFVKSPRENAARHKANEVAFEDLEERADEFGRWLTLSRRNVEDMHAELTSMYGEFLALRHGVAAQVEDTEPAHEEESEVPQPRPQRRRPAARSGETGRRSPRSRAAAASAKKGHIRQPRSGSVKTR